MRITHSSQDSVMVIDEDAQTSHRQEEIDPQFEIDSQEKASANTGDALYKNSNTSSTAHYDLFTHDDIENFMDHSAEGTTHQVSDCKFFKRLSKG